MKTTQMVCTMALCALDGEVCPPVHTGTGTWSMGIREQTWSKDCCWLWGDGFREWEGGNPQQGMLMEENWTAMEEGLYC